MEKLYLGIDIGSTTFTSAGRKALIPQYVLQSLYTENGAMTKITLK